MTEGQRLLREALKGRTQIAMAEELDVDNTALSRWAAGERAPGLSAAVTLRDRLGIPVEAWTRPADDATRESGAA